MENTTWWNAPEEYTARRLIAAFKTVVGAQKYREEKYLRNLRLYSNVKLLGLSSFSYLDFNLPSNRIRLNVVKAVIDTACAIIGTKRSKAKFLTEGGTRSDLRRAKLITKFNAGMFYKCGVYSQDHSVFQDATIFGTGAYKVHEEKDELSNIRCRPTELWVDEVEAKDGEPLTLYRYKDLSRDVVAKKYGLSPDDLSGCGSILGQSAFRPAVEKPVGVLEGWRLPSYKGAGDGLFAACATGADRVYPLDRVKWEDGHFPFTFFRYGLPPFGFWGLGITDDLEDIQIEINWILRKIQNSLNLASSHILVKEIADGTATVNYEDLTNRDLGIVRYKGEPPLWKIVQAISPEYYQQLDRLWQRAFEITGISQLAAMAKKPAGLDSKPSLREYSNIQSQRFQHVEQRWEQMHVELADRNCQAANRLDKRLKEKGGFRVAIEDRGYIQPLKWSELDFDPDRDFYFVKRWPVSLLPDTPSGKIEAVTEISKAGLVDPQSALRMVDHPDLEAIIKRATASREVLEKIVEQIIEHDKYIAPLPIFDLELGVKVMANAYMEAVIDDVPEKRRDKLVKWANTARAMLEKEQRKAMQNAPTAMPPGGGPIPPAPGPMPPGAPPMQPPPEMTPPALPIEGVLNV